MRSLAFLLPNHREGETDATAATTSTEQDIQTFGGHPYAKNAALEFSQFLCTVSLLKGLVSTWTRWRMRKLMAAGKSGQENEKGRRGGEGRRKKGKEWREKRIPRETCRYTYPERLRNLP